MKTTITKHEYYELLGLLTLAQKYMSAVKDIENAACDITGDMELGHVSDYIYGSDSDVDALLGKLGIAVKD